MCSQKELLGVFIIRGEWEIMRLNSALYELGVWHWNAPESFAMHWGSMSDTRGLFGCHIDGERVPLKTGNLKVPVTCQCISVISTILSTKCYRMSAIKYCQMSTVTYQNIKIKYHWVSNTGIKYLENIQAQLQRKILVCTGAGEVLLVLKMRAKPGTRYLHLKMGWVSERLQGRCSKCHPFHTTMEFPCDSPGPLPGMPLTVHSF